MSQMTYLVHILVNIKCAFNLPTDVHILAVLSLGIISITNLFWVISIDIQGSSVPAIGLLWFPNFALAWLGPIKTWPPGRRPCRKQNNDSHYSSYSIYINHS